MYIILYTEETFNKIQPICYLCLILLHIKPTLFYNLEQCACTNDFFFIGVQIVKCTMLYCEDDMFKVLNAAGVGKHKLTPSFGFKLYFLWVISFSIHDFWFMNGGKCIVLLHNITL